MLWRGRTESWIVWLRADGPEGARVRAQMMRLGLYQRLASYDTLPTPLAPAMRMEKRLSLDARAGARLSNICALARYRQHTAELQYCLDG
jgi:hypothetical protein